MKTIGIADLMAQIHSLEAENTRLAELAVSQESAIRERDEAIARCVLRGIKLRDVLLHMRDHEQSRQEVVDTASEALHAHEDANAS